MIGDTREEVSLRRRNSKGKKITYSQQRPNMTKDILSSSKQQSSDRVDEEKKGESTHCNLAYIRQSLVALIEEYHICSSLGQVSVNAESIASVLEFELSASASYPPAESESLLTNILYHEATKDVGRMIMNLLYLDQHKCLPVKHLISLIYLLQEIVHNEKVRLPSELKLLLSKQAILMLCTFRLAILNVMTGKSGESKVVGDFKQLLRSCFTYRCGKLADIFGLVLSTWTIDFILSVFDALFGQEGEGIMSQLTMDTLILLMIYFSLSVTLIGKRKAVLGNLIHYYEAWIMKEYRVRVQVQLNLLARCYHEQLLTKDWSYESLTIDIPRDKDILPGIIIQPIAEREVTLFDNIIITSSWESE